MMEKKPAQRFVFESADHISGLHGGKNEFPTKNAEGIEPRAELWPTVTLNRKGVCEIYYRKQKSQIGKGRNRN